MSRELYGGPVRTLYRVIKREPERPELVKICEPVRERKPRSRKRKQEPMDALNDQWGGGKIKFVTPVAQAVERAKSLVQWKRKCKKGACKQRGASVSIRQKKRRKTKTKSRNGASFF